MKFMKYTAIFATLSLSLFTFSKDRMVSVIQKGGQFVIVPMIHNEVLPEQPLAQSLIATTMFYMNDEMTPVTCDDPDNRIRTCSLETETEAANNIGYFVGNYATRKLTHIASDNGYNKQFLIKKSNDLSNTLPAELGGYQLRENIRPIMKGATEIATHPLVRELAFHAAGLFLAKQCADYMTRDNNRK